MNGIVLFNINFRIRSRSLSMSWTPVPGGKPRSLSPGDQIEIVIPRWSSHMVRVSRGEFSRGELSDWHETSDDFDASYSYRALVYAPITLTPNHLIVEPEVELIREFYSYRTSLLRGSDA